MENIGHILADLMKAIGVGFIFLGLWQYRPWLAFTVTGLILLLLGLVVG
jgi:hypothetical protein